MQDEWLNAGIVTWSNSRAIARTYPTTVPLDHIYAN